uniref:Voltage-gated hydrogen channel 1 n=1 Tax=Strigamia maritima TaxID=126957 RepID=T1IUD2_STRMM
MFARFSLGLCRNKQKNPLWIQTCNESTSGNESNLGVDLVRLHPSNSNTLSTARIVFKYTTLTILSIFTLEMFLRVISGRANFFTRCMELFDALVVLVAFALGLAFLSAPRDGRDAALSIILLRLWRIKQILQSLINNTKRQMTHVLNAYKRDKIQAEHKVELLILKVEDLEHEVAYLKEKLKRCEREATLNNKPKKSSAFHHLTNNNNNTAAIIKHKQNPLPNQQRLPPEGMTHSPSKDLDVADLYKFADTTVKAILRTASNELGSKDKWQHTKSSRDDKGLSPLQFQLKPISHSVERKDDKTTSAGNQQQQQQQLDELSEIERIRTVHFDPSCKHEDVPITAL